MFYRGRVDVTSTIEYRLLRLMTSLVKWIRNACRCRSHWSNDELFAVAAETKQIASRPISSKYRLLMGLQIHNLKLALRGLHDIA